MPFIFTSSFRLHFHTEILSLCSFSVLLQAPRSVSFRKLSSPGNNAVVCRYQNHSAAFPYRLQINRTSRVWLDGVGIITHLQKHDPRPGRIRFFIRSAILLSLSNSFISVHPSKSKFFDQVSTVKFHFLCISLNGICMGISTFRSHGTHIPQFC